MISAATIEKQIKELGVKQGDVVFLAADLLKVGYFSNDKDSTLRDWVNILINVVDNDGTLVVPSYTNSFSFLYKKSNVIFSNDAPTTSGSLSQAFQKYPGVLRSQHPTNSCFAIGKYAKFILDGHDEKSSAYLPYQRVVSLKGKNLMLGAIEDAKLAPMGMHCAQESLDLTRKNWLAGVLQTYYYDQFGNIKIFTRNDVGGCTGGAHKAIGYHIIEKAITFGKVGRSLSAYIDCEKSFSIFKKILKENPALIKCDGIETCGCCYGSPIYRHPLFWLKKIFKKIMRLILISIKSKFL